MYLNESKLNPGSLAIIVVELQIPRIGSYNMSCGPEGIFIIDDKNNKTLVAASSEKEKAVGKNKKSRSKKRLFKRL